MNVLRRNNKNLWNYLNIFEDIKVAYQNKKVRITHKLWTDRPVCLILEALCIYSDSASIRVSYNQVNFFCVTERESDNVALPIKLRGNIKLSRKIGGSSHEG